MIVRIALLVLSLSLVAHGVKGLASSLDERTSLLVPAIEAVAGLQALLVLLIISLKARRRASAAPETQTAGADDGQGNNVPARIKAVISRPSSEFRRLMLVNLPPYAALSALESAPPLGGQQAVQRTRTGSVQRRGSQHSHGSRCRAAGLGGHGRRDG